MVRPPVVVVLGHVDHGKTTLLDTIRKTNIVTKESGGITQHIGAYQIEYKGKLITFIDTPGHEAFCQMRSRGAKTADIAILVVAGEEGVRPQTKEVIDCIKKEELPTIVVVNKMDNPLANFEKTIGELEKEGLMVEQRGGKTPAIKVSAVTGIGIDELLEMIILLAEMEEIKVDILKPASGVVIESYMDSRKGATATFLVLEGILEVGQWVVCGSAYGKVKNLNDFKGEKIDKAEPSTPAIVIGLNEVPVVGDMFEKVESEEAAVAKLKEKFVKSWSVPAGHLDSESVDKEKAVNVILKTDVHGSLEAIGESLAKLELGNIGLKILKADVGDISEADVKLAYPADAVIIGFRVKTSSDIENMAKRSGVKIRNYDIIYELFEGIKKEASKLLELESNREDLGKLKVIAIFRREKTRMIVGGKVSEGKIVNKTHIDIMRNEEKVGTGKIIQLQHNKQDMAEVEKGREAGIMFEGNAIIEEGDVLECYRVERKKREL
ncbi:MAG: translation initiation factor IF-2 [Candidatus Portnoybacteria bacterium]|nr:translation initiation factor IF-2 [Candidatus Portnoybacteria bacterium]